MSQGTLPGSPPGAGTGKDSVLEPPGGHGSADLRFSCFKPPSLGDLVTAAFGHSQTLLTWTNR